jgi:small subunit ribosomal protein S9
MNFVKNLPRNMFYALTTRKTAKAQITIKYGTGLFFINKKNATLYFLKNIIRLKKFTALLTYQSFFNTVNIFISVSGGGLESQLDAICFGLMKILIKIKLLNKNFLKKLGITLTDYRIKERKKYGLKKARKASQFSKR